MEKQVTFSNNIEIVSTCDYDKVNKVTLERIIHELGQFELRYFYELLTSR